ncbi:MAG: alpha/beta fold hydrolase [Selenomonadaceae bacterium]|nr:alpha/beta fold hydrolase [Selenomonadaceae bacterium]
MAGLAAGLIALGSFSIVDAAKPIVIQEQGSFTVGGTYKERPGKFSQENFVAEDGQRAYGDFAYVEYQIPVKAKKLPLIFQHGGAQSKRTWESGPDGREGFNTMFVRAGYSVYLIDQPRSGEANLSTEAVTPDTPWASNPMYGDKTLYVLSRIGHYDATGNPVPNAQFPEGEKNYQAFQQSWTICSDPLDNDLNAEVLAELVNQQKDGAILITHSMGGTIGWRTAIRTNKVWGTEFAMAEQFVAAINRHGGDATLVHLPKIGIKGNSHFLMQEQNNEEIMKLALAWLKSKGLDK